MQRHTKSQRAFDGLLPTQKCVGIFQEQFRDFVGHDRYVAVISELFGVSNGSILAASGFCRHIEAEARSTTSVLDKPSKQAIAT